LKEDVDIHVLADVTTGADVSPSGVIRRIGWLRAPLNIEPLGIGGHEIAAAGVVVMRWGMTSAPNRAVFSRN
jgi:hypothetical protein